MTTLVAVRVPDELVAKMDAEGKRSAIIIEALRQYLTPSPNPVLAYSHPPPITIDRILKPSLEVFKPSRQCRSCEGNCNPYKGKWVCSDASCPLSGVEQGRV